MLPTAASGSNSESKSASGGRRAGPFGLHPLELLVEGVEVGPLRPGLIEGADRRDVAAQVADLVDVGPVLGVVAPAGPAAPRAFHASRSSLVFLVRPSSGRMSGTSPVGGSVQGGKSVSPPVTVIPSSGGASGETSALP